MPDEIGGFQTSGLSWAERAQTRQLNAVLAPRGSERINRFLHSTNMVGARVAAALTPRRGVVVDFGCGTGRFVRYFGSKGYRLVGTEITSEMLLKARKF